MHIGVNKWDDDESREREVGTWRSREFGENLDGLRGLGVRGLEDWGEEILESWIHLSWFRGLFDFLTLFDCSWLESVHHFQSTVNRSASHYAPVHIPTGAYSNPPMGIRIGGVAAGKCQRILHMRIGGDVLIGEIKAGTHLRGNSGTISHANPNLGLP